MLYRWLCFVLVAFMLSACGQAISVSLPQAITLPTAAVAHRQNIVALPTPNHQLVDTAILDDLVATPQPTAAIPTQPIATTQPTPEAKLHHEPTRLVIDDIALDLPLVPVGLDANSAPIAVSYTHLTLPTILRV